MKKIVFSLMAVIIAMLFSSCQKEEITIKTPVPAAYTLKMSTAAVEVNDTIYSTISTPILFFVTDARDTIVTAQIDFGDGTINGGKQLIHSFKTAGTYQLVVSIIGTNVTIKRTIKITDSSLAVGGTIIQISGSTVGDSASINLLCRKDRIYQSNLPGKYFLKGDMNSWKTAISPIDTDYTYNGVKYVEFNFKVLNGTWNDFDYYKVLSDGTEQWSYDPTDSYWDSVKGLYKFYVTGAQIYSSQPVAYIPGSCGDIVTSTTGPCIRLDYQTGIQDSLIIYANRNYLTGDSTKYGISYMVDGQANVMKAVKFLKGTNYIYVKVPVEKTSAVSFKTYSDRVALTVGNMTSSMFYRVSTGDCYLTIAGTINP